VQALTRSLGISTVLFLALSPVSARADLTGAFAEALDVDPEFLTGVASATDIAFAADGRAVVTQKGGEIAVRRVDGSKNVVMGAFTNVDTGSEKGLLGVVAHPSEANTFFFYVSDGESAADKHRVYKGTLTDDDSVTIDLDNPIIAASVGNGPGLEGPANHDGGGLFIHDGKLFVGVGDTGANSRTPSNKYSSCLNKGNGKILRVNLDGSIPDDNPLVGVQAVTSCDEVRGAWGTDAPDERVYAWGFRNPWRFWIDSHTNRMWIGDVGEQTREEVSLSSPVGDGYMGEHFGYPFIEGAFVHGDVDGKNCDTEFEPGRACVEAIHDYETGSEGSCVIGGIIPEGCGWEAAFDGKLYYVFADNSSAWIHALEVSSDRNGVVSAEAEEVGTFEGSGPASIRQGPAGAIYVVMNRGNAVYEIKPKVQTGDGCESMGGSGGASGSGGDGGSDNGGMSGAGQAGAQSGGTAGSAPQAGRGGSSGAGGRGGTAGTSSGTAGSSAGSAGSSGGSETPAEDEGGCGCRVAGGRGGSLAAVFALLGLAGSVFARRRARSRKSRD
jgi:MYXO-CTERM domain-containing protein